MAKQTVNLGTMADNKSGDPLRTAFEKINENFDELYAATGSGVGVNVGDQITEPSQVTDIVFSGATVENVDGVSTVTITPQNIPDIGDVSFNGVSIIGKALNQSGTQIWIGANYNGDQVGVNGTGLQVPADTPNIEQVEAGWILRFANGDSVTLIASYYWQQDNFWVLQWNDNYSSEQSVYPVTVESPDYQAGDPTHLVLSSGNTAPGSAIDIKETQIDMNYAGFGTGFSFSPNGLVFPDSSVQTTASTGGGSGGVSYQATLTDINGDWHQGSPNTFSLDDWSYDIINVSQNGAVSNITLTLPSNPAHGKMQTIKYSGVADTSKVCNIIANQNIENLPEQTITISKNNGYVTFVWDNDWATWWIISKDLADAGASKITNNGYVDTLVELDLTATINKVVPTNSGSPTYHLADGTEGQIMYIVAAANGETQSEYTSIQIDNVRSSNANGVINQGQGWWWLPFRGSNAPTSLMLIFADGAWNVPHNAFD